MPKHAHAFAPGVVPLRLRHDHLRENPAPAFWEQLPFHLPQRDDQSCGLASLTQVTSALLARRGRSPVSQDEMALALGKDDWTGGVTLAELEALAIRAHETFSVEAMVRRYYAHAHAHAHAHAFDENEGSPEGLRDALLDLERGGAFVIVNVALEPILGVGLGHHPPVGAYDRDADLVLLLDTFRQGWEPYWAPRALLWQAMSTIDQTAAAPRGYLVLRAGPDGRHRG